jgi:hypothetical protein
LADNNRDCWEKGRRPAFPEHSGEKNGMARLSKEMVLAIRKDHATGLYSQSQLAKKYQTGQAHIWRIIHRLRWRNI